MICHLEKSIILSILIPISISASLIAESIQHDEINEENFNLQELGIIGGDIRSIQKYPYAASLSVNGTVIGAGGLLNRRWLITSASIKLIVPEKFISIRVDSDYAHKSGYELRVSQWLSHPNYKGDVQYDLALVKFNKNIPKKVKTKSLKLTKELPPEGTKVNVVGWGWGLNQKKGEEKMAAAAVPILSSANCKKIYSGLKSFTELSFCTNGDKGPCQNDLGAPIVHNNQLLGIFSTSFFCGEPNMPTIYTDATKFEGWIQKTISKK